MSDLVILPEFKSFLGDVPSKDDQLLTQLLNDVEALFESETGHPAGFYRAAGTARTEVHDGTGSSSLYLDYPVAVLTSVKLGYNAAAPDETLAVANKAVITYGVGSRRLTRTDGLTFGKVGQARFVEIVYDFSAHLPADAKLAIKSVAAIAYRRRGSEEVQSESVGSFYSRTMVEQIAAMDPFWQTAVVANSSPVIA